MRVSLCGKHVLAFTENLSHLLFVKGQFNMADMDGLKCINIFVCPTLTFMHFATPISNYAPNWMIGYI